MKKAVLLCAMMLSPATGLAGPTVPGTVDIAWNDCWLGAGEATNLSNASTSTAGFESMYVSFDPPTTLPAYVGCAGVIDLQTNSPGGVLSAWWRFDLALTTCHGQKMSHVGDLLFDPAAVGCVELFGNNGGAAGGGNFATPSCCVAPPSARIKEIWAFANGSSMPIAPGTEYYAFKVTIRNSLNPGFTLATCPGCLDRATIMLNQVNLSQPAPTPDIVLTTGPQTMITWQQTPVPTRPRSWGMIKALYH